MEMREFIDKLFARAAEKGLRACEVYYESGSSFSASVFKGEVVDYSVSDAGGLGFRALVDGKMGYASTQALDDEAIEMLTDAARTNAELIGSADKQFMFGGGAAYEKLDLYSPAVGAVTAAEKLSLARRMEEKALKADSRIEQVEDCGVFSESRRVAIVNTMGLDASYESNIMGGYLSPVAKENGEVSNAFKLFLTADPAEVDVDGMIAEAVSEAIDGLKWEKAASGTCPVILRWDAMTSILYTFSGVFSADSAQKGMSLLKGREGEMIAADCVSIIDDPHMAEGAASRPFDGEGVPTYKKEVVKAGVLTTLLHNMMTAHKQGVATTGNASRASYSSPVGVSPSNFYIAPGEKDLNSLMKEMGEGLLITSLQGLHAGANAISGDFSLSARGYFVKDGARAGAVRQITVAGNFFQLLKDIAAVGSDLKFGSAYASGFACPSVLVRQLSVAGK
jgi:PmbA protein